LWTGGSDFFLSGFDNTTPDGQWGFTFWMFQVVFAGTAATIVSGAVAERVKFSGYLIYTFVIAIFIYPVFGHWAWGNLLYADNAGAWLADKGFIDFAGSTVVHSVGGWAALAGAIMLGPRLGKYDRNGNPRAIPGHSLSMATLGALILFLGWFGFNAGSTTAGTGDVSRIAVNTFLSGCAGAVAAIFTAWARVKKPDISMAVNGSLAGLVAITAPCATVTTGGAILIGLIAGILVVFAVLFFDDVGVDDPVGAISVHLVNGIWGTLAAALLHENLFLGKEYALGSQLWAQILGVVTCGIWAFPLALLLFYGIKVTVGLRVTELEEIEGLDLSEHGARAYPDFTPTPASGGGTPSRAI
jgi:Amt family ammonium transporter